MGLVKGACPLCTNKKMVSNKTIFPVNLDSDIAFCPNCLKKIKPIEAQKEYNKLRTYLFKKADAYLFDYTDANKAYKEYANILEIESDSCYARLGRILSLVRMSTVRKSYISAAHDLFVSEYDQYFAKHATDEEFIAFFKRLYILLNRYTQRLQAKLTYKNRYYDLDCASLFLLRNNEILEFFSDALKVFIKIGDRNENTCKAMIKNYEKAIDERNTMIYGGEKCPLIDGTIYRFVKFEKKAEQASFVRDTYVLGGYHVSHAPSLKKQRHHSYINDRIYRRRTGQIRFYKTAPYLMITFLILGGIFGYLFYHFNNIELYRWIFLGLTIFSAVEFIVLLILRIVVSSSMKKRRDLFASSGGYHFIH